MDMFCIVYYTVDEKDDYNCECHEQWFNDKKVAEEYGEELVSGGVTDGYSLWSGKFNSVGMLCLEELLFSTADELDDEGVCDEPVVF